MRDKEPLSFERTLPVLPGSLSMKRTEAGILVKSPVEREAIWYTFVTKSRRLQGGRLALQLEDDVWQGRIEAERVPRVQGLYVVLSSEADGRSASTVGFPLDGQEQTYEVWDAYLIDGLPQVRAREVAQRTRFRLVLGAYAAVCGVLSMIIFWIQVRRSDVELATSLRRAGAAAATQNRNALPLLIAVLCLFFAFSATVLWIVAR
jgi:hypothetical protein